MNTTSRALILLLAMLWQALAWLTPMYIDQQKELIAHLVVHVQEVDHHHHDHQSLHVEEDAGEPPHQHANQGVQQPGLAPVRVWTPVNDARQTLLPGAGATYALVFLQGELRPPQDAFLLA